MTELFNSFVVNPIVEIYQFLYEIILLGIHNYGPALLALSLLTSIILSPLEGIARKYEIKEKLIQSIIIPQINKIKQQYKGAERSQRISRLYYRYAYNPLYAVRSAFGILIQLPFLFGAYMMLSAYEPIKGHHFGPIKDLSLQDGLLFGINVLPFLMTFINLCTIYVRRHIMTMRDMVQAGLIALFFLVLLYTAPAALLIYWTGNNAISLIKSFISEKQIIKNLIRLKNDCKNKNKLEIKISSIICTFYCICIPLTGYWDNINEFDFSEKDLFVKIIPLFLIASIFIFYLLKITKLVTNRYKLIYTILLVSLIVMLFENMFGSYNIPILNGEKIIFSKERILIDSLIITLFTIFVIFINKKISTDVILCKITFLLIVINISVSFYTKQEKVVLTNNTENIYLTSKAELYNKLKFSVTNNIIVISADAFDTASMLKFLEIYPEYKNYFNGFQLFSNNLGAGGQTKIALPQIMAGETFDGKTNYRKFVENAIFGEDSMPKNSLKNNRISFFSMSFWNVINENVSSSKENNFYFKSSYPKFIFKYLPYWIKSIFISNVNYGSENLNKNDNIISFEKMAKRMDKITATPVTQYLHLKGVHPPYTERIAVVKEFVDEFIFYLTQLKEHDLFDNSVIILTSDHGDYTDHRNYIKTNYSTFNFPLLMIKMQNSKDQLIVREEDTSSVLLNSFFKYINVNGMSQNNLDDFIDRLPKAREIYVMNSIDNLKGNSVYEVTRKENDLNFDEKFEANNKQHSILSPNKIYTFNIQDTNYEYADPQGENLHVFGGPGLDLIDGINAFKLNTNINYNKEILALLEFHNNNGTGIADLEFDNQINKTIDTIGFSQNKYYFYKIIKLKTNNQGDLDLRFNKPDNHSVSLTKIFLSDESCLFKSNKFYKLNDNPFTKIIIKHGWNSPERHGTWSSDSNAYIELNLNYFNLKKTSNINIELKISFLNYPDVNKNIKIYSKDNDLLYSTDNNKKRSINVSLKVPNHIIDNGIINLRFNSNVQKHSKVNPLSKDTRTLGFFLTDFKIN